MPRPKGYVQSPETLARISAGGRRAWDEKRRPYEDAKTEIFAALESGDENQAKELYREFMAERQAQRNAILAARDEARADEALRTNGIRTNAMRTNVIYNAADEPAPEVEAEDPPKPSPSRPVHRKARPVRKAE